MKTRVITSVFIAIVLVAILLLSNTIAYSIALSILAVIAANEVLKVYDVDKKYLVSVPAYLAAAAMPTLSFIMTVVMEKPAFFNPSSTVTK